MSLLSDSQHLSLQLKEIEKATNNFETCIGKGGYGRVYKGELVILGKHTTVAVKRLNEQLGQGLKEFLTEIQLLHGLKHPNLISLFGFCEEGQEKILVYEYAERGSLDSYLRRSNATCTLTWLQRLKICIDVARGLDHLHNHVGKHQTIIHRDMKSANILIDQNWVAKISDLGLSKLSIAGLNRSAVISHACGTPGYCEPEYIISGIVKKESDIYSFGMVLFEVFCGRLCTIRDDDDFLLTAPLAKEFYDKNKLQEIVDPSLKGQTSSDSLKIFSDIAYGCLHDDRKKRLPIGLVLKKLGELLKFSLDGSRFHDICENDDPAPPESQESEPSTSTSSSSSSSSSSCRHFEFLEIQLATKTFDQSLVIGRGGFGEVYKGTIFNGSTPMDVAIKRLDSMSNQGADEFRAEVEVLSKFRHRHIVSLIGYCIYEEEMILVNEYMPNGTLADHLHKLSTTLSWIQRLKICIGAGRGLDYLHTGIQLEFGVIHRDIKSSNILLHENWAAKISDFGLSIIDPTNQQSTYVKTDVKGTFGYMDPDYFTSGKLSRKTDVYAFGVVLFEVLCRKRAVDSILDEQWGLASWAQKSIKEGNLKLIIDPDIRGQMSRKCLNQFVSIAERCLLTNPKHRPIMSEVVVCLESVLRLQEETDNSLQAAGPSIFGRMPDIFSFISKRDTYAHGDSKVSSNSKGNNRSASNTLTRTKEVLADLFQKNKEVLADFNIPNPSLKVYEYADLERATRNFSQDLLLGKGGFGEVFLGWVDNNTFATSTDGVGIAVAVKRRKQNSVVGHAQWLVEVSLLGRLTHPNIISLLGYCSEEPKYFLVYEYFHNRNFGQFLYGDEPEPLSWRRRLSIMIGVACGLTYLHSAKDEVVCCGVKSSDILLDQDFNAKLRDFGVARLCREIRETVVTTFDAGAFGYIDPHYYMTGQLSAKTDVYSFGVVLLETLTGLQAWDVQRPDEQQNLVCWASPILARKEMNTIMDPRLDQNYPSNGALKCAALALRCLAEKPKNRPSSKEVLQTLEQIYAVSN